MATCNNQRATEQQEMRTLKDTYTQTLSAHIIFIHLEELQDCKTSRDAKQKEVEELRGQHQQTQRIIMQSMSRGVRRM